MTKTDEVSFLGGQRSSIYDAPEDVGTVTDVLAFMALSAMRCFLQGAMVVVYRCDASSRLWVIDCDTALPRKCTDRWPEDHRNLASPLRGAIERFMQGMAAAPEESERRAAQLAEFFELLGQQGCTGRSCIVPDQVPPDHSASAGTLRGLVNVILSLLIAPFASGADRIVIAFTPQSCDRVGLSMYDDGQADDPIRQDQDALFQFANRSKEWFYTTRVGVSRGGRA